MSELDRYLSQSYRHDILRESVRVEMPAANPKLLAEIKVELARINAIGLGANLPRRDFVAAQDRRALERLLRELEAQQQEAGDAPDAQG